MMDKLDKLFSAILVCDRDLNIIDKSAVLARHMPQLVAGRSLTDAFNFIRPASIRTVEDIENNQHSLFLLVANDEKFALRGQMLRTGIDAEERVIFAGSPWLIWLNKNRPSLQLDLSDFAPADAQMDQLFYMSTEQQMVSDLEELNTELLRAKHKIEIAQEEKNTFYAQMSHEMRTPLNGVASALTLLSEVELPFKASELVSMAQQSSDNLLSAINQVLDIARLEKGAFDEQSEIFELHQLLDSVLDIVRPRAIGKDIRLNAAVEAGLPQHYRGLKERLHQALLNLASNAVKFTDSGSISLHAMPATKPGSSLRIEVADTGVGIDPLAISKIFQPFYTSNPKATATQEAGTGLGLDIAQRNIDILGGVMGVDSKLGDGTTFWLELPLEPVSSMNKCMTSQLSQSAQESPINGHVMLVEDNQTNRLLCTMILEGLGVTVSTAANAEDAIKVIAQGKPDLVFMDISLPGIDGHEASHLIRQQFDQDELPIIALTAYASIQEQEKSIVSGMNDYLIKPVGKEGFRESLARWLPLLPASGVDASFQPKESTLRALESEIGEENLRKVILKFCEEATSDMAALVTAEDAATLAKKAHLLTSTCESFALPILAEQFRFVEKQAIEGKVAAHSYRKELATRLHTGLEALIARVDSRHPS